MKNKFHSLTRTTLVIPLATLLSTLALPACGDVVDGLSASSAESALCRSDRCDDDAPGNDANDDSPGDDARNHGAPPSDAGAGSPGSGACKTNADCAAGYECEAEHGASYCKPHGGHDDRDDRDDRAHGSPDAGSVSCDDDIDCAADERCESIGGGQRACSSDHDDDRSGPNRGRH